MEKKMTCVTYRSSLTIINNLTNFLNSQKQLFVKRPKFLTFIINFWVMSCRKQLHWCFNFFNNYNYGLPNYMTELQFSRKSVTPYYANCIYSKLFDAVIAQLKFVF